MSGHCFPSTALSLLFLCLPTSLPALSFLSLLPPTSSSFSPPFPPHLLSSLHPSLPLYSLPAFFLCLSSARTPHLCHRIGETDLVASLALASRECRHKELPQVLSHFALLPRWPLSAQMNPGMNSGPQPGGGAEWWGAGSQLSPTTLGKKLFPCSNDKKEKMG